MNITDDSLTEIALWLHPEDAMALSVVNKHIHLAVQKLLPRIITKNECTRVGDRIWFTDLGHWNPWSAVEGVVEAKTRKNTLLISDRWGRLHKRSVNRVTRMRTYKVLVTFNGVRVNSYNWRRFWCPVCRVMHYHPGGKGFKEPKCIGRMHRCFSEGYMLL